MRLDSRSLLGKAIDNSQVIREVDPRASRDLWWLILLGAVLVLGGVLYAWPHLQLREAGREAQELSREKERLLEENRKLRLEKAALQNLRRVEAIATRDLGLKPPAPERTVVVEIEAPVVPTGRLARAPEAGSTREAN
jgi:cell division protein FtsL